jgi:hypothetical protein
MLGGFHGRDAALGAVRQPVRSRPGHAVQVRRGMVFMAYSMTLGTRNRPRSTAGALRWLASRWSGSLTTSSRRRSATVLDRRHRVGQRLDAGGVHRAHLLDDVEKAVDLAQHPLTVGHGQFQPGQAGNALDVGESQGHGANTEGRLQPVVKLPLFRGGRPSYSQGMGYYPAFGAAAAKSALFHRKSPPKTRHCPCFDLK